MIDFDVVNRREMVDLDWYAKHRQEDGHWLDWSLGESDVHLKEFRLLMSIYLITCHGFKLGKRRLKNFTEDLLLLTAIFFKM